jgi:hypothetical protein
MKAISIQQPWAWAILHAGKDVENRTWTTRYRGEIAVHATRLQTGWKLPKGVTPPAPGALVQKAVLGVVEIVEVVSRSSSPWFTGPHGFVLRNPRPLQRPVACPGNQNIWELPPAVARQVRAGLAELLRTETSRSPAASGNGPARLSAVAARQLTVTQGNLDNNHVYLTDVLDLFPQDAFGGPNAARVGRCVRVLFGDDSIETDIVQARRIFRRRGWLRRFFADNRIRAGDRLLLEQLEPYVYRLRLFSRTPLGGADIAARAQNCSAKGHARAGQRPCG